MNTFKKAERLCSRKEIDALLKYGRTFSLFPFKIVYYIDGSVTDSSFSEMYPASLLISVPKKLFKRAVKRNLLKRRIREAYRLNKELLNNNGMKLSFMILYNAKIILSYKEIDSRMKEILPRISKLILDTGARAMHENCNRMSSHIAAMDERNEKDRICNNRFYGIIKQIIALPFLLLFKFYQICISPLKPASCRFTPTCSQYAIEALKKYGPFKGLYLAVRRILRCHPWGGSGYDPVP